MRFSRTLGVGAVVAALMAGWSWQAEAAEPRCLAKVSAVLDELGIAQEQRREISVVPRIVTTRDGSFVAGYDAWVRLTTCSGALIVDLRRDCRVKQIYTRGDCSVAGVKAF